LAGGNARECESGCLTNEDLRGWRGTAVNFPEAADVFRHGDTASAHRNSPSVLSGSVDDVERAGAWHYLRRDEWRAVFDPGVCAWIVWMCEARTGENDVRHWRGWGGAQRSECSVTMKALKRCAMHRMIRGAKVAGSTAARREPVCGWRRVNLLVAIAGRRSVQLKLADPGDTPEIDGRRKLPTDPSGEPSDSCGWKVLQTSEPQTLRRLRSGAHGGRLVTEERPVKASPRAARRKGQRASDEKNRTPCQFRSVDSYRGLRTGMRRCIFAADSVCSVRRSRFGSRMLRRPRARAAVSDRVSQSTGEPGQHFEDRTGLLQPLRMDCCAALTRFSARENRSLRKAVSSLVRYAVQIETEVRAPRRSICWSHYMPKRQGHFDRRLKSPEIAADLAHSSVWGHKSAVRDRDASHPGQLQRRDEFTWS